MSDILDLSAYEIRKKIIDKEILIKDVLDLLFERIKENDNNSFITLCEDEAYKKAEELQKRLEDDPDGKKGKLFGIAVAIKDNICTKGIKTTAASKILYNFVPEYNATVIDLIEKEDGIIIGKTNMDEFAMGSTSETSYYGAVKNPLNNEYVSGGSSGGSASAVAGHECFMALGSDTGGSIRQPAGFCGVVGIKPTYSSVSRYGLIAYGSSLDQIGPIAGNVTDAVNLLEVISAYDPKDSTSKNGVDREYSKYLTDDIKDLKIGIPKEYLSDSVDADVRENIKNAIEVFKKLGCEVKECSLALTDYVVPAYYTIASAEASSNLERFDGVKYGLRADDYEGLHDMYKKTRKEGFGTEVKRRIMLGSFVLSSGYYDAYYLKALRVRNLIKQEFDKLFKEFDVILSPVSPETTPKIGESLSDPIKMYLSDVYTVSANLTGMPGISIPCGIDRNNMPVGMQLFADHFREDNIIKAAYAFEKAGKGM